MDKKLEIERINACAVKIVEDLENSIMGDTLQDFTKKKDAVAVLHKLAQLLIQINKLRLLIDEKGQEVDLEDEKLIENFLRKKKNAINKT
ncbi:hypothetical protein [Candidatus Sneabacter namystus]|uniref:Uncharacterized protein n=1 Tax=Candidatus Sneabacter namystus TaxID=2601646 RepID=A0A5C0UID3_9RICK|nr:hypothetical protein [Candidatus Sneabacter namystus]QEK39537.1 hypothetical protein FZC37_01115 [Candidatus Sneabacter namystus]